LNEGAAIRRVELRCRGDGLCSLSRSKTGTRDRI
jgi:hypothetical protein